MTRAYSDNTEAIRLLEWQFGWANRLTKLATLERIWNAAKADLDAIRQESEDEFKRLKGPYEQARRRVG